jgi:tetratricopeptide (TPR) repeat protein
MLDTLRGPLDTATDLYLVLTLRRNMKFFGRKKSRSQAEKATPSVLLEDNSFYDPKPTEAPLTTPQPRTGARTRRSASVDSPVRRRENDNRTANRDLLILMLKIVLIPLLIIGGFFALKAVAGLFDEPSENEIQQSDAREKLMNNSPAGFTSLSVESPQKMLVNRDFLADRISRWEQAERHLRAAESLELRSINNEAIARLKQALEFAPDNREAQRQLLELYMDAENYAEAIPLCIRLLDQDSTQWDLKISLLTALQGEGQNELCLYLSDQLLRKEPNDVNLLEVAAYSHAFAGDAEKALDLYKQILEKDPKNLLALEGAGFLYREKKEWMNLVPYYLKLLELAPQKEHYLTLARSYAQLDDSEKSIVFLGQAYSLYGEPVVSPWLLQPEFDPIRETSDFRSFADMVVGAKRRAAIEQIRQRDIDPEIRPEVRSETEEALKELERLPTRDLEILNPLRRRQR